MIRVELQPEPADFESTVRRPGYKFLNRYQTPSARRWERNSYWRRVLPHLHAAYRGICAYSCHWLPRAAGACTVDHLHPKTKYPELAYEWSNYRLASLMLNARKKEYEDVLDPFEIENGWFTLDFPSLLVRPEAGLEQEYHRQVQATIDRLRLNDEAILETRWHYLQLFCSGDVSLDFLKMQAPFIAAELVRQNLVETIHEVMKSA